MPQSVGGTKVGLFRACCMHFSPKQADGQLCLSLGIFGKLAYYYAYLIAGCPEIASSPTMLQ